MSHGTIVRISHRMLPACLRSANPDFGSRFGAIRRNHGRQCTAPRLSSRLMPDPVPDRGS